MTAYIGFNSLDEWRDLVHTPNGEVWVEADKQKAGCLLNTRLASMRYTDIPYKKYVLAYSRYHKDKWTDNAYPDNVTIIDNGDKRFIWPYKDYNGLYCKKNLLPYEMAKAEYDVWKMKPSRADWPREYVTREKHEKTVALPETPPALNLIESLDLEWCDKKPYDIFFAGKARDNFNGKTGSKRSEYIEALKRASNNLGLKSLILDRSQMLTRREYMEKINQTSLCCSFSVAPMRCRREAEILLGGACLLNDPIIKACTFPLFEPKTHFQWLETIEYLEAQLDYLFNHPQGIVDRIETAYRGFQRAQEYKRIPSIDMRFAAANIEADCRTFDEVERWEHESR